MKPYNADLIYHLQAWGLRRNQSAVGLGYADSTTVWRAYHAPGRSNKPPQPPDFTIDRYAARAEFAYWQCMSDHQLWLWWSYVRDKSIKQLARQHGVAYEAMRQAIRAAHEDIAEHMEMACYVEKRAKRVG